MTRTATDVPKAIPDNNASGVTFEVVAIATASAYATST